MVSVDETGGSTEPGAELSVIEPVDPVFHNEGVSIRPPLIENEKTDVCITEHQSGAKNDVSTVVEDEEKYVDNLLKCTPHLDVQDAGDVLKCLDAVLTTSSGTENSLNAIPNISDVVPVSSNEASSPSAQNANHCIKTNRLTRFPSEFNETKRVLFEGLVKKNSHFISLTKSGYYTLFLNNTNQAAWDSLLMGIGKMSVNMSYRLTRTGVSAEKFGTKIVSQSPSAVHSSNESAKTQEPDFNSVYFDPICDLVNPNTIAFDIGSRERENVKLAPPPPCNLRIVGSLSSRANQEKYAFIYSNGFGNLLEVTVTSSLSMGMRIRCMYGIIYCEESKKIPLNPSAPFPGKASILSLDGGGVLGISSLKILERLEYEVRRELNNYSINLVECFDLIAGTSTGGIIALAMLGGKCIKELIDLWASVSGRIFEGSRSLLSGILFEGYEITRMKEELTHQLGYNFLSTFPEPYCFVTATDVLHQPYELFLLRNYEHHHIAPHAHSYRGTVHIPVWVAGWATSAAPTYLRGPNADEFVDMGYEFEPRIHLVDGAMKANNPTLVALEETARLCGKSFKSFIDEDLHLLVSVGTGQMPIKGIPSDSQKEVSTLQILLNSAHLLTSATAAHREVLHWLTGNEDAYFRFNAPGIGDIPLDSGNPRHIDLIIKATNEYLTDEKYYDLKRFGKRLAQHYVQKKSGRLGQHNFSHDDNYNRSRTNRGPFLDPTLEYIRSFMDSSN